MRCLILALLIGLITAQKFEELTRILNYQDPEDAREQYEEFKRKYKKDIANDDDEKRFNIFKYNLMRIQLYRTIEEGTATYEVNEFADLSAEEFAKHYTLGDMNLMKYPEATMEDIDVNNVPNGFDWREKGAVTPVAVQGSCMSSWAFSAVGNIEGQWFRKTQKLITLSKQQLLDCDKKNDGCHGGLPSLAYDEIKRMGGLQAENTYRYKNEVSFCRMSKIRFVAHVNGSIQLPADERKHAAYLAENGPLSVILNSDTLQFYSGGILHPSKSVCNPKGWNLAALTVGFGNDRLTPYWIVKNNWGKNWGESGYFRMFRGDGTCGIDQYATSAIIK